MSSIQKGDYVLYKNNIFVADSFPVKRGIQYIKLFWTTEPKHFTVPIDRVKFYLRPEHNPQTIKFRNIQDPGWTKIDYCEDCKEHNLPAGSICPVTKQTHE